MINITPEERTYRIALTLMDGRNGESDVVEAARRGCRLIRDYSGHEVDAGKLEQRLRIAIAVDHEAGAHCELEFAGCAECRKGRAS